MDRVDRGATDMPTKRKRKSRNRRPETKDWELHYLRHGEVINEGHIKRFFINKEIHWPKLWELHRDQILSEWAAKYPGTRPFAWWEFNAPRQPIGTYPGCYFDGGLPEPRLKLKGAGTPNHEALNYVPRFCFGLPTTGWVSRFDVEYYNGRAKDIHGKPIGMEYKDGHFPYEALDPNDPPVYESEATYLKRHGLLREGEEERADFTPETIQVREQDTQELNTVH